MARFTPPRRNLWWKVKDTFKAIVIGLTAMVVGFGAVAIWLLLATAPLLIVLFAIKYLFFSN